MGTFLWYVCTASCFMALMFAYIVIMMLAYHYCFVIPHVHDLLYWNVTEEQQFQSELHWLSEEYNPPPKEN